MRPVNNRNRRPVSLEYADMMAADDRLTSALNMLQLTLTHGETIRRCPLEAGQQDCAFAHANPPFSGTMAYGWSVERPRRLADGRIATWFFAADPAGNFKLIGLNQERDYPGGDNCREAAPGQLLCAYTPYIATAEFETIRTSLGFKPGVPGKVLDPAAVEQLLSIIRGN